MATKDTSCIPVGCYCYGVVDIGNNDTGQKFNIKTTKCPYWSLNTNRAYQENGYCSFLEEGDWQYGGLGTLWDQVKICGINEGYDFEQEETIPIDLVN